MSAEQINKLKSFTKEEIIYGIEHRLSETDISLIIHAAERKRIDEDFKKTQQAIEDSQKAFTAYSDFLKELSVKYGDGKSFNPSLISDTELKKLSSLYKVWEEKERLLNKYMHRYDGG